MHLEPVSLIAALAAVTSHIGLISTATTTYNEPYNIARRFATIDHISGGRAGWNLVTSQVEDEAGNFGLERHVDHAERYERAGEFYDVVAGLWDSWEADAFLRDKASGVWFDFDKMHFLHHRGEHFSVRGPLNVSRTPQAAARWWRYRPGSSDIGRKLAARSADLVFTAQVTVADGQAFCIDLRDRAERYGRGRNDIKILPGLMPIVGRTDAEAAEQFQQLQELIDDSLAIRALARLTGDLDIYQFPLDGPLPDLPPSNAAKARQELIVGLAREKNLTIRQVARYCWGPRKAIGSCTARRRPLPIRWRNGCWLAPATGSICCFRIFQVHSTILSTLWCRNYSAAAFSERNMRDARCGKTSAFRNRPIDTRSEEAVMHPTRRCVFVPSPAATFQPRGTSPLTNPTSPTQTGRFLQHAWQSSGRLAASRCGA